MGFYVRKSVKAGPFRFNMSKSGVGVSVGVPGFRVGTGPRGNYVHMGRGGVYYRASMNGTSASDNAGQRNLIETASVVMEDVTGATVLEMESTGGGEIVQQLNAAARHFPWAWVVTSAAVVLGAVAMPWGLIIWTLAVPFCWWMFLRDASKRKVVLFYDVNDAAASWFDAVVTTWDWFMGAQKLWRIVASGDVQTLYQHKTNAGASALVKRVDAVATLTGPKHLATNVAIPSIVADKTQIFFLPDRLLLKEGKFYTDVSYRFLDVRADRRQFIESPGLTPRDSQKVGETWQYVNKKGGPDRRFANNPVLPIMLYSNLYLTSKQGLNWQVQCSRPDAAPNLAQTLDLVPTAEVAQ